ncbi:MAG: tRNA (adenosine(37)-N6)-threonylcarbamoyltransferase complex dimerization subunit type 1 TsaB [Oscillospiraceae bacterium]|nr:tRNA (adenosine(37)-N6)-threonylcarbamoyltransferase complex dimerization subunit type 1 TsaB [Oscillospiraceae bacterium]
MLILGIDTSGKTASSAVYDSEQKVFLSEASIYTRLTHSQIIISLCNDVLKRAEKNISDIDIIAVANGPGSYTGLRIGISSVKAMSFVSGAKVCGISTLESLAYNNIAFQGIICSVIKARENLVYASAYCPNSKGVLHNIIDEQIMPSDDLIHFINTQEMPVLLCGDGAEDLYNQKYSKSKLNVNLAPPHTRLQNACGICLASLYHNPVTPEDLSVSYMQKVKAEKDLEKHK